MRSGDLRDRNADTLFNGGERGSIGQRAKEASEEILAALVEEEADRGCRRFGQCLSRILIANAVRRGKNNSVRKKLSF